MPRGCCDYKPSCSCLPSISCTLPKCHWCCSCPPLNCYKKRCKCKNCCIFLNCCIFPDCCIFQCPSCPSCCCSCKCSCSCTCSSCPKDLVRTTGMIMGNPVDQATFYASSNLNLQWLSCHDHSQNLSNNNNNNPNNIKQTLEIG